MNASLSLCEPEVAECELPSAVMFPSHRLEHAPANRSQAGIHLANGRCWERTSEAIAHFGAMLRRYETGQRISASEDHSDLLALVAHYDSSCPPGARTKTGHGIQFFSKQINLKSAHRAACFHIHRLDGTVVDFSFRKAVKGGMRGWQLRL